MPLFLDLLLKLIWKREMLNYWFGGQRGCTGCKDVVGPLRVVRLITVDPPHLVHLVPSVLIDQHQQWLRRICTGFVSLKVAVHPFV
jgi:hypothetical protein